MLAVFVPAAVVAPTQGSGIQMSPAIALHGGSSGERGRAHRQEHLRTCFRYAGCTAHAWDPRKTAWPPLSSLHRLRAHLRSTGRRWWPGVNSDGIGAKVVAVQQNLVKPRSCDVNENVISESCRTEYGISEEQLKNAVPLEQVIDQFSQWARARLEAEAGGQFYFVTDGQLTLRQALHPEAVRHGILLPDTFYHFFDLRKEFQAFYGKAVESVQDMLACILLPIIALSCFCASVALRAAWMRA
ncbi:hypothetical protein HPB51_019779 [Rhipicephalus microplus]|uniref:Uncharacterized protein n=1 Tax=Rhipicephalus microplus TaxID=6941 RepID=A0A9J6DCD1_RHIMP|nr:hypothetical protein HPB51_019779 [Rhipicephalus microplus]